jgi:hypothetical protein
VRDAGGPVVIRNEPFLGDGTPMPTLYWLVSADVVAVGKLEAAGGVRQASEAVGRAISPRRASATRPSATTSLRTSAATLWRRWHPSRREMPAAHCAWFLAGGRSCGALGR